MGTWSVRVLVREAARDGFARGWDRARAQAQEKAPSRAVRAPVTFGARLRELRTARGWTRTEFAERMGVRYEAAKAWEARGAPNRAHLAVLVTWFPVLLQETLDTSTGSRRAGMRLTRDVRVLTRERTPEVKTTKRWLADRAKFVTFLTAPPALHAALREMAPVDAALRGEV